MEIIEGNIIDIYSNQIYPGEVFISGGTISKIKRNNKVYSSFLAPGFVDAHVHIESSMLTPTQFSALVVSRGTLAIVNDPHEIANVMGEEGIRFMLEDSCGAMVKCFFGIPSCVPATPFDSSGGVITPDTVERLAATGKFVCLSEVMDVPGVLCNRPDVVRKLEVAKKYALKIDGHAPLLSGTDLQKYVCSGISTDHESSTLKEASEKIVAGMKIMIREGSAAKNYDALKHLIQYYPESLMFCTDDAHPDDILQNGHIDRLVRFAIRDGFDLFSVWRIASLNPIGHYKLPVGTLREGENADFIRIGDLDSLEVLEVYKDGVKIYEKGRAASTFTLNKEQIPPLNRFFSRNIEQSSLRKNVQLKQNPCIELIDGEIMTLKSFFDVERKEDFESDVDQDILKIVYLNRYADKIPQISWIKGMGLKEGAFATSIAHDSHNILAVGCTDADISAAINKIMENKGGLVVKNSSGLYVLELPIGGIMSDKSAIEVAETYKRLILELKKLDCKPKSPFMTLAFMSLLVISELKIGEHGLFDFNAFRFLEENSQ